MIALPCWLDYLDAIVIWLVAECLEIVFVN